MEDGNSEIYTVDADGENLTRLTNNDLLDVLPIWSPDGSKIALYSDGHLSVMDADGSNLTRLAFISDWSDLWLWPEWSPDGSKIAFTSFPNSDDDDRSVISVVDSDGSNLTFLTDEDISAALPSWSPDGSKIAFAVLEAAGGLIRIYVMDADGSNVTPLTDEDTFALTPSWSPDGSKIAFTSDDGHIWVTDADGGNLTRLAFFSDWDDLWIWPHSWSRDGSKIAFSSYAEDADSQEIYTIDADGGNLTRLTNTDADSLYPQWSPDGSRIAFTSEGRAGTLRDPRGPQQKGTSHACAYHGLEGPGRPGGPPTIPPMAPIGSGSATDLSATRWVGTGTRGRATTLDISGERVEREIPAEMGNRASQQHLTNTFTLVL